MITQSEINQAMSLTFQHPVIGQEAVTPDGLGRVVEYEDRFPFQWIRVRDYITGVETDWLPGNVRLVRIQYEDES